MVVREGAAKPDISSVEAFRNTLLAAKSIAYSDSGSGTYLSTTLFSRLGVADQIAGKSRRVRGPPSGEPVAAVVARGEAEIGFQQVSELIHVPGITFVGAHSGRGPADVCFCRRARCFGPATRGSECTAPIPRFARSVGRDPEGRIDAALRSIAGATGLNAPFLRSGDVRAGI